MDCGRAAPGVPVLRRLGRARRPGRRAGRRRGHGFGLGLCNQSRGVGLEVRIGVPARATALGRESTVGPAQARARTLSLSGIA